MNNLIEEVKKVLDEDLLFEMSTLKKNRYTKLPVNIWLSIKTKGKHNKPRLKIQNNKLDTLSSISDLIPVSIEDEPEILIDKKIKISNSEIQYIKSWIKLNKENLLKFWNQEIDFEDLIEVLKF